MNKYLHICTIVFIIIGFIIKIIGSISNSKNENYGEAKSTIWGYGMVFVSLILQILIRLKEEENNIKILTFIPYFIVLVLLFQIIMTNKNYSKEINSKKVAKGYGEFSAISTCLIIIQIYLLFMQEQSEQIVYLSYITTILNIMIIIAKNVIVRYFSTDG